MFRIALSMFFVAILASGCATTGVSTVAGYGPDDRLSAPAKTYRKKARNSRRKSARKRDLAPRNSYSKAPKGAFNHKSYRNARLDPSVAVKMINNYRASKGLKPLKLNAKLVRAAKAHARDLATYDRISHQGSDGSDPWDRVKRMGYKPQLAAENVGTGQASLAEVMKGWKDSPGHNANLLLPDATQMGIALIKKNKTEYRTFWVLALGTPVS